MKEWRLFVSWDSKWLLMLFLSPALLKFFVVCSCSSFACPGFRILVDCQWSWWFSFWLELILCGMMWYAWYAFYWDTICMILAGSASLCQTTFALNPVGIVVWKLGVGNWELCLTCISWSSHGCQPWSTSRSMSLSLWLGTSRSFEDEHFCDKHQLGTQFHRRWGSEGLLCPGIPSGCSWCLCLFLVLRFRFCWPWLKGAEGAEG